MRRPCWSSTGILVPAAGDWPEPRPPGIRCKLRMYPSAVVTCVFTVVTQYAYYTGVICPLSEK
jgi:hypothetical protein